MQRPAELPGKGNGHICHLSAMVILKLHALLAPGSTSGLMDLHAGLSLNLGRVSLVGRSFYTRENRVLHSECFHFPGALYGGGFGVPTALGIHQYL